MKNDYDLVVIGGGPAGMAAALSAREQGLQKILILERDECLGGILNQCIHNGFGLHYFKEELTGPEYAGRFIDRIRAEGQIEFVLSAMVLSISQTKEVVYVSSQTGYRKVQAGSVILAMGCRERTRGAVSIAGTRPSGIFTAGCAQRYLNIDGYMVGKRILILGSGDIGLIMARRLSWEGAEVLAVVELLPYSSGLNRNIVQCLQDQQIPLYLSHTITEIRGDRRVTGATIAAVDENRQVITGSEQDFDCDTILFSVGLIPENELSKTAGIVLDDRTKGPLVFENMETSVEGIFACGNVVHVHDLVDYVSQESERAGRAAADYIQQQPGGSGKKDPIQVLPTELISYTVPQRIRLDRLSDSLPVFFRVKKPLTGKWRLVVTAGQEVIAEFRRQDLTPGGMEQVTLGAQQLDKLKELQADLHFDLVPAEDVQ